MGKELVLNEVSARQVLDECIRAMRAQADEMEASARTYEQTAAQLDTLAAAQEVIAATAMKTVSYTDSEGHTHTKSVPDEAARAAAAAKAKEYRTQAELLRAAAKKLRGAIETLMQAMFAVQLHFSQIQGAVQEADLAYARQIRQQCENILRFTEEMRAVREGIDDSLRSAGADGLPSIAWGPLASVMVSAFGAAQLAGKVRCCAYGGDPVNLATGNFVYSKTDLEIPGRFPLEFKRTYNSSGGQDGPLGPGWSHNFWIRLCEAEGGAHVFYGDGRMERYEELEGGRYAAPPGRRALLLRGEGGGHTLTLLDSMARLVFNGSGLLVKALDRNGNHSAYSYNGEGRLCKVQGPGGAYLSITYDADGLLTVVTDGAGRQATFSYEGGLLVRATHPSGATYGYGYDRKGRLCTLTDPFGTVALENKYDASGRVARQRFADGGEIYYDYKDDREGGGGSTTLTRQDGSRVRYERDDRFRTTAIVWPDGAERKTFDAGDNVTSSTDKRGNVLRHEYNVLGRRTRTVDPLGYETRYEYSRNKLLSVTREGRKLAAFSYDALGNLTGARDALGREIVIEYGDMGLPVKAVDAAGCETRTEYDERGNIASVTDALGAVTRYEYDGLNRVVKATRPGGGAMAFRHDDMGNIVEVVNAEGNTRRYAYDKRGKVTEVVDWDGTRVRYAYNEVGKLAQVTDPAGGVTRYEYDKMWNLAKVTNAEGAEVRYEYDKVGRLAAVVDPCGHRTSFGYDPDGNRVRVTGPGGAETRMEYDALNQLTRVVDAGGGEVRYAYDAFYNVTEMHDAAGGVHKSEYDEAGQLVRKTDPLGNSTSYTYDVRGLLASATNADGATIRYEYDAIGRLIRFEAADGAVEHYEYDADGRMTAFTDALGARHRYEHDAMDRVVSVKDPLGGVTRFCYDAMDRVTRKVDENGNATSYAYDAVGNLTAVTGADGSVARYGYDRMRRMTRRELVRMVDPALDPVGAAASAAGAVTTYAYDERGLLACETDPLGAARRYEYDAAGQLVRKTDRDGSLTEYEYDPVGMLTKVSYADGTDVERSYGPLRQLAEVRDALGVTRLESDAIGRVTAVSDAQGETVRYGWTGAGAKESIGYPDGTEVRYRYDAAGRLAEVLDDGALAASYSYDAVGHVVERMLGNGVRSSYAYNPLGRLDRLEHKGPDGALEAFRYAYDAAGNKTEVARVRRAAGGAEAASIHAYTYDSMNRLATVAQDGAPVRCYGYDALGNRAVMVDIARGAETRYEYDAMSRLTRLVGPGGEESVYSYDPRGNLVEVARGGVSEKRFIFDAANRLVSATAADGSTAAYSYDGFGHRVKSVWDIAGGGGRPARHEEMRYVLDITKPYENVLAAIGTGGAPGMVGAGGAVGAPGAPGAPGGTRHVWGNELLSAAPFGIAGAAASAPSVDATADAFRAGSSIGAGAAFGAAPAPEPAYYLLDELRSPVRTLDARGQSQDTFTYDEFGVPLPGVGEPEAAENLFGYTGYQPDPVTGLCYAQARYYMPETGRFISEDAYKGSALSPQTQNDYAYCNNNPLVYIDPSGNERIPDFISMAVPPSASEGQMAHLQIETLFNITHLGIYNGVNKEIYARTFMLNNDLFLNFDDLPASKGGRPDIIYNQGLASTTWEEYMNPMNNMIVPIHVYEIKPISYSNLPLFGSPKKNAAANAQIDGYVNYIQENSVPGVFVKRGTDFLPNGLVMPFWGNAWVEDLDKKKMLVIYTDYATDPGLVYYKLIRMPDYRKLSYEMETVPWEDKMPSQLEAMAVAMGITAVAVVAVCLIADGIPGDELALSGIGDAIAQLLQKYVIDPLANLSPVCAG
ncbi:MAG: DUF6531 domain-containing protein [Clostridiales Family XIII bacterium]|jgi:RHS repeat-associated protein|nr:DUF6531 domain-containing protein [Clostridiales Family XIII bacterium]